jgi:hypothetical protein
MGAVWTNWFCSGHEENSVNPMRWIGPATWVAMLLSSPSFAFTFTMVNGSTDQLLTWRWQYYPAIQCQTCGNVSSINGEIPLNFQGFPRGRAGGLLDWTASSGKLTVVAMPIAWANVADPSSWSDTWGSVDSRTPPSFMLIPEAGESIPFTANLLIRPRIVGTLERFTSNGGQAQTILHMTQAVDVNGQTVTSDELHYDVTYTDGGVLAGPVSFPKGTLNNVVVPNVQNGSIITIPTWAYMRSIVTGIGSIDAYSSYCDGLALEIEISNANAVAVEDAPATAVLSLTARPNPGRGLSRIAYRLPRASDVRLTIYDLSGRTIARLVDGREEAGDREVSWNGRSAAGDPLAAGVYVMELIAGTERRVGKLVRLDH